MEWKDLKPNYGETAFYAGGEMKLGPYMRVMAFHAPGLAPVKDETGWYHIRPDGSPLYALRYRMAYGYYCGLAAVLDDNGWFHIDVEGRPVYGERRPWVGNFQQERCTVRDAGGAYFHILPNGARLYAENYLYAGDYYDGQACICNAEGMYTHLDLEGRVVHGKYYRRLGVFHKGYATAGDETGMFHIDKRGFPAYAERFLFVEPFYNGVAFAVTHDGRQIVVGENGKTLWLLS